MFPFALQVKHVTRNMLRKRSSSDGGRGRLQANTRRTDDRARFDGDRGEVRTSDELPGRRLGVPFTQSLHAKPACRGGRERR